MSAKRFYNLEATAWAKNLEANVDVIRKEMQGVLEGQSGLWISGHPDYVKGNTWKTFELVFFGINILQNQKQCPETTQLLSEIPELVTADFSVLPPHTDILPHKGYSRMITRCHLPLIVPRGDLGIEVEGETRVWEEGKLISFDDSLSHRAWNHTDEVRVVMMIDVASEAFDYSADEICRYKIENIDDPYLLSMAPKEKWLEMYESRTFSLG
jgi:beta-hydroxylase